MFKKVLLIVFLIFGLSLSVFLISQTAIFKGQASNTNSHLPVKENSYLFASPIQAKADGQEKIRITVFLLDSNGLGVSQQQVSLKTPSTLQVESLQSTTDDLGKATFNLSSSVPGKFEITASTPTFTLTQKINVLFL